jgi:hypothetical protein
MTGIVVDENDLHSRHSYFSPTSSRKSPSLIQTLDWMKSRLAPKGLVQPDWNGYNRYVAIPGHSQCAGTPLIIEGKWLPATNAKANVAASPGDGVLLPMSIG